MAVHNQSVIPTWVNDFYPDFYVALTDQEEYAYDSAGGIHLNDWKLLFQELVTNMETWKTGPGTRELRDFVSALYSLYLLSVMYGEPFDPAIADAYYVFSMNEFIQDTLTYPVSYYDDIIQVTPPSDPWTSVKISAEKAKIAAYTVPEEDALTAIQDDSRTVSSKVISKALFEDQVVTATKNKQEMGEYIYNDLHYKQVVQVLATDLELPSYIT